MLGVMFLPLPKMTTNFFYFDQTNQKHGLVSEEQLKELVAQGIIGQHTPLETDTGYTGVAGQIPGLFAAAPNPFSAPMPMVNPTAPHPPVNLFPDVITRKARIAFWTMMCSVALSLCSAAGILCESLEIGLRDEVYGVALREIENYNREHNLEYLEYSDPGYRIDLSEAARTQPPENAQLGLTFLAFLLVIPTGIAYLIFYFFYLYRLWDEIPREFAQTTPGNMAGFALIPVFNMYWQFIAFLGLYQGMNRAAQSMKNLPHGTVHFHTRGILLVCIGWLILGVGSIIVSVCGMLFNTYHEVVSTLFWSIALTVVNVLITIPAYWAVCYNVHKFIDIKSSMGK